MGNKGSNTTTQTSSSSPSPQAMDAYTQLLNRAQGVAGTPYTPYGGELVAGVNGQQNAGIGGINQYAGFAQPYIQQAAGYANNAAQPLTAAQIQQYQDPFTQQVVNATQAQFNQQNQIQQSQLKGNEIAQGALGGDRNIIAASTLANQQQQAQAPVIAGLYSHGYGQALQTAEQQQQNQANAAYSLGNLGVAGQNAGLTGATAQIGAGSLQQGTQQALDAAQLQQFQTGQAFPYQQTQWLAGLDTGVGSQMGGTSTGTTTAPPPNPLAQLLGLGVAGVGAFAPSKPAAARGGRIRGFAPGGDVGGGFGGTPYAGVGWIPSVQISPGRGAPPLPSGGGGGQQQAGSSIPFGGMNIGQTTAGLRGLGSMFDGSGISTDAAMAGAPLEGTADAFAASTGFAPEAAAGLGDTLAALGPDLAFLALRRGGGIRGFADGGSPDGRGDLLVPSFADRWATLADTPHAPLSADDVAAGSPFTLPDAAHGVPRPTVNYSGGDIDATDINLDADRLGLGSPYSNTNPAIDADAGAPRVGSPDAAPFDQLGHRTAGADVGAGGPLAYGAGYAPPTGDDSPTGAAAAPQAGFGFGLLSPAAKQGLLAAGFGMMASRSPFLGNAIGEGGLAGLNAYSGQKATEFAQEQKKLTTAQANRRLDLEQKKLSQAAEQARRAIELKTQEFQFNQGKPATIGHDPIGQPILGRFDPKTGGYVDPVTGKPVQANAGTPSLPPLMAPTSTPPAVLEGDQAAMPAGATLVAGDAPPVVQPAVLASLDPNMAAQVKALDEGRMAFPSGFALKSPYWQHMLQLVSQYDPSFDAVNYNARAKVRADFVAGKSAQNITSFNTAIGHLDTLDRAIDDLHNYSTPLLNKMTMEAARQTNPQYAASLSRFQAAKTAVTDELTRAFRGSGGNVHDIMEWSKALNEADSPQALHAATKQAIELLHSRIESVGDQYNRGMGTTRDPLTLLSPHAQTAVHRIAGDETQHGAAIPADPLADARAAIARGVSRDAVLKRLQEHGIDATGL